MKKLASTALAVICALSTTFPAFAAPVRNESTAFQMGEIVSQKTDSAGNEKITVVTGDIVEEIEITADGIVYVNGRNITTVTESSSTKSIRADSDWIYAGSRSYHYDLSGLTVAGGVSILKGLGKTIAASTFKTVAGSWIVNSIFESGCGIEDTRDTYYRNIQQQRPDMKEVHSVNFYVDLYGSRQYEAYLCGFTTGG